MRYPIALTIAGSDSGGGAGIQADIKAISATGSYAASVITAVTAQNTLGVQKVHPVPSDIVEEQINSVLSDIGADAVKIGMLFSSDVINAVARALKRFDVTNIVHDPVMVSTSGHKLMEDDAISTLKNVLMPTARVITPNIPEAEAISGERIIRQDDLPRVARQLSDTMFKTAGKRVSVMLKAGHLTDSDVIDIFYNAEEDTLTPLHSKRIDSPNTHGTGCTLSSAFASFLAQGYTLNDAARAAKDYIARAIASGAAYTIGHGHGPVDHFFKDTSCRTNKL